MFNECFKIDLKEHPECERECHSENERDRIKKNLRNHYMTDSSFRAHILRSNATECVYSEKKNIKENTHSHIMDYFLCSP